MGHAAGLGSHWDVIVLGLGGVGSAAARALARRGARVLGLERFELAHDRGSSHGESRIIRKAYFEHPDYVPLLSRAYDEWADLERESGERLFERVGVVLVGPPDGEIIAGTRRAAAEHALPLEVLDASETRRRFPFLAPDDDHAAVFEADAGFLRVEACVRACAESARRHGADLRFGAKVASWDAGSSGVSVIVDGETHRADQLIVTAGAWAPALLGSQLGPQLASLGGLWVQRQPLLWLRSSDPAFAWDCGAPCWGVDAPGGFFYGFPALAPGEAKLARHGGGERADPDALDRTLRSTDVAPVCAFAARYLRGVGPEVVRHAVCMYTMTPDAHFLLGRHPHHERVLVAAGLSGHGFKMTTALGAALAELALDGATREPIAFLSPTRSALSGATR